MSNNNNKPDFNNMGLGLGLGSGSPVSHLQTRPTPTTSSSSSGSVSIPKAHSGELTVDNPAPGARPGHTRSYSTGSMGGPSVSSPQLNALPTGNICPSGPARVHTRPGTGTGQHSRPVARTDVLGSGTGNYGHGSIIRGAGSSTAPRSGELIRGAGNSTAPRSGELDPIRRAMGCSDPEEVKRVGNEEYKKGNFEVALRLYDRAIELSPSNAAYRSNRAAALTGLGRVIDAVRDCEDAVRLDPKYARAHLRLGSLLIRLGEVEVARKHLFYAGQQPGATDLHKLQAVEKHLNRCSDARKMGDWKSALREGDAAITAGADHSPQLFSCRAESLLKLQQLDDIDSVLAKMPKVEPSLNCFLQSKFSGMISEAYLFYVRAQIEMAFGRFENAVNSAEKAGKIDPRNFEVTKLLHNVRLVEKARNQGNNLYMSERFTEACQAYGEGLKLDPSNSVFYCNRAACWFKLGMWENSIEDCNSALHIRPSYTKALLRRAASNKKLERWAEAVRDYEVLRKELPNDNEVTESLFHAQVALKKSLGEEISTMKFGGDPDKISGIEQFITKISSSGVSVVHFEIPSNPQCKRLSSFLDILYRRYPSINFLEVNVEESTEVAKAEDVRIVPTFKIYKNGSRVKEIVNPTTDVLEASVKHYSF